MNNTLMAEKTEGLRLSIEKSVKGRRCIRFPAARGKKAGELVPASFLRKSAARLPELSELEVVRHFTCLSRLNYSLDTNFYPLGSCTMKYNPRIYEEIPAWPEFAGAHPWSPDSLVQGTLEFLYGLERELSELCGMDAFTLQPAAGAHGELAGVLVARAYHRKRKDSARTEIIIPDSAHGTNPATANMGGFSVVGIKSGPDGRVDVQALKKNLGPKTALVMLTVPNTLGLFETDIKEIAGLVHEAGGLLYMDGANFNALIGLAKPGDFGVDILHLNMHKTFGAPHGGGGPGAGGVGVKKHLEPFLPVPRVVRENDSFRLRQDYPDSIGMIKAFFGNVGVLMRAYCYMRQHSPETLGQISRLAIIHANYLRVKLKSMYPSFADGHCMHECVLQTDSSRMGGVRTLDVAKRLLDLGSYAPTVYFPLIVPEALMIEPTETESKQAMDWFVEAMTRIYNEANEDPDILKKAPHTLPVKRLDEVGAARQPNLCWS